MKYQSIIHGLTYFTLSLGTFQFVHAQSSLQIEDAILKNQQSFYFVDFKSYPNNLNELPIGVFDSGTGGLTVLDALVNFDEHDNQTKAPKKDGQLDFRKENFIYLADQANMPYGNYHAVQKDNLLKEHIIKDIQFLLSDKYYPSHVDAKPKTDK